MTEPVTRQTLLQQHLANVALPAVEMRRITLQPDVVGGAHHHNGPVFGVIESGSVHFQVEGGTDTILRAGDVFYEPAGALIDRFDATDEGVTFVGCFLNAAGERPVLTAGAPAG